MMLRKRFVEPGELDLRAVVDEPLLDAGVDAARPLGLEIGIAGKNGDGLNDCRIVGSLMPRPADALSLVSPTAPRRCARQADRSARHGGGAEAVVVLDADADGDEHARPQRLVLQRIADVVAARLRRRSGASASMSVARSPSQSIGAVRRCVPARALPRRQPPVGLIAGVMPAQLGAAVDT